MNRRIVPTLAIAALIATACSGGSDDAASSPVDAEDSNEISEESAPAEESAPEEESAPADEASGLVADLPQFLSDFDRVCTTETGFGGATPYSAEGPGPHPFVLMQESDSGNIFERDLSDAPAGWNIQTDANFDDNSEIVPTELIACSVKTGTTPTGIMCDLEMDDDSTVTLEVVDQTFELTIREATTGNAIGTETIEATDSECPFFVFIDEGDTQYFNTPDEDQYINALKPYVAP